MPRVIGISTDSCVLSSDRTFLVLLSVIVLTVVASPFGVFLNVTPISEVLHCAADRLEPLQPLVGVAEERGAVRVHYVHDDRRELVGIPAPDAADRLHNGGARHRQ